MKIHEYQAKEIFREYGIPVPAGLVATTPDEAVDAASRLGGFPVLIKAQVHAGGRGKAGGVSIAHDIESVRRESERILGMRLVTHQTGPEGKPVSKVLVEKGISIKEEIYLGLMPNRENARITIMGSLAGGMDIEEVAARTPEKIVSVQVNPLAGIHPFHCRRLCFGLEMPKDLHKEFSMIISSLYRLLVEKNASLVEINPLVITADGQIMAADAKIDFDDNALFLHPDIKTLRDISQEDPLDVEASRFGLNYINLDGNVGNMVNGAGLAMAVMDGIKLAGAEPANFLDVGGGATSEMIENGFSIILSDPKVKVILINIFGGILRCDVLAEGVIKAAKNTKIDVPVVIRLEGTNVDKGKELLAHSGLTFHVADDLKDACRKAARLAMNG